MLIKLEVQDNDITVHCSKGHETFALMVRIRLKGASVKRFARCTTCGEEGPIDAH
jgi:hypothetical protein